MIIMLYQYFTKKNEINPAKFLQKALAYPAFTKYNKSIPATSSCYVNYLIYYYIFEISPPAKLFIDTIHCCYFTDTVSLTLFL